MPVTTHSRGCTSRVYQKRVMYRPRSVEQIMSSTLDVPQDHESIRPRSAPGHVPSPRFGGRACPVLSQLYGLWRGHRPALSPPPDLQSPPHCWGPHRSRRASAGQFRSSRHPRCSPMGSLPIVKAVVHPGAPVLVGQSAHPVEVEHVQQVFSDVGIERPYRPARYRGVSVPLQPCQIASCRGTPLVAQSPCSLTPRARPELSAPITTVWKSASV